MPLHNLIKNNLIKKLFKSITNHQQCPPSSPTPLTPKTSQEYHADIRSANTKVELANLDAPKNPTQSRLLGQLNDPGFLFVGFCSKHIFSLGMIITGAAIGIGIAAALFSNPITIIPAIIALSIIGAVVYKNIGKVIGA